MGIPTINENPSGEIHVLHWTHATYLGAAGSAHVAVPRDQLCFWGQWQDCDIFQRRPKQNNTERTHKNPQKKGHS